MCIITGKSKLKTATGYKVSVKRNGKYYSLYTKVRYFKNGKIGKNPYTGSVIFEEKMANLTGIFVNKDNAESFKSHFRDNHVLLKMKLGCIKYQGYAPINRRENGTILIGSKILSMEEIK